MTATQGNERSRKIPWAGPVELHVGQIELQSKVSLHGASPWHQNQLFLPPLIAAIMITTGQARGIFSQLLTQASHLT